MTVRCSGVLLACLCALGCAELPGGDVLTQTLGSQFENDPAKSAAQPVLIGAPNVDQGPLRLFDLGPAAAGDQWTVSATAPGLGNEIVVVALFDDKLNLLARRPVLRSGSFSHVVRRETPLLRVGVSGSVDNVARANVTAARLADVPAPAPHPQAVWLDFGAQSNLRIANRAPISYAAFDAAILGTPYAGQTAAIQETILATLRAQYAGLEVEFFSSPQDGPPPPPYSTVFFGGWNDALLGTADGVDRYNRNPEDRALVFIQSFSRYGPMRMPTEQMALMIANTAAHELGHLLGLYHTHDADSLMDTRGTAWEFAGPRHFGAFPLEADVFPVGLDDAPQMLVDAVGLRPGAVIIPKFNVQPRRRAADFLPGPWSAAPPGPVCDCESLADLGE